MIPFFGVARQYQTLRQEILDITDTVLTTGQVLDGAYTQKFEQYMAQRCGRKYAVAVNSGTQALVFAQQALGLRDKRIMIPGISFVATLNSVIVAGNTPVFCDTDSQALLDIESIDYALNGQIDAIMYVNIFGNCVDYDRLTNVAKFFNEDIQIIEDAAQSFGASYHGRPSGSLGDISILSFDPTKNLPNYGSGGMLLTDDYSTYTACLDLRNNGKHRNHDFAGTNSKMSEVDCAQMLVKLKYFDSWQARRKQIADYYTDQLCTYIDVPLVEDHIEHAWHKYVIRINERHSLQAALTDQGIETKIHYQQPLFEYASGWDYIDYSQDIMRESMAFTSDCLSLPIYPEMTDSEVDYVVSTIRKWQ